KSVDGHLVRVFSGKRYGEKETTVDIFAHNPDRCWPLIGWKLQLVAPEFVRLELWGQTMAFERRCFRADSNTELVYFGALVAGQPIAYRLDQYLAFGLRCGQGERSGTLVRALDRRFWGYIWASFKSRRPLKGAKHFIRISTPVENGRLSEADQRLQVF